MAKKEFKKNNNDYANMPDGFKQLVGDIKKDNLKSVILICGKEQYLVKWTVNDIIKKYINKSSESLDFTRITDNEFKLNKIIEAGDTVSMLSPKRVVLLEDFFYAEGKTGRRKKSDDEQQAEPENKSSGPSLDSKEGMDALCEYLRNVPDSTLMIFTCEIPSSKSQVFKTIEECGSIYVLKTLGNADLKRFIEKRVNAAGKTIRPEVIQQIISMSGYADRDSQYTLYNLENDINKIIAHAAHEYVTGDDVEKGINGNEEAGVFQLIDSIMAGNKDAAYRILFKNIESSSEGIILQMLPQIVNNFELILFAHELKEEGKSLPEAAAVLGKPPTNYPLKKAWGYADSFSTRQLKSICKAAYEVESNFKKGLLSDTLAMEMFIAKV